MEIQAGARLVVITASGATVQMRALGAPMQGRDFPVVWVCDEVEYQAPDTGGTKGIPWPLDAVREAQPVSADA